MRDKYLPGQVGLLLLVIIGVVVALVMSIASRSLSDTVLSRQERESSAVFAVAETGIENALSELSSGSVPPETSFVDTTLLVSGNYKVAALSSYALYLEELESAQLDLPAYIPSLTISWIRRENPAENITTCTEGSGSAPAAIEVSAITATGIIRSYYNTYDCNPPGNGFDTSTAVSGGTTYRNKITDYDVPPTTTAVRIKPIYAGATVDVTGTGLQTQLYLIQSRATGGDAQKEIEVRRGLDAPPSIFDFAIFSGGTIVKSI